MTDFDDVTFVTTFQEQIRFTKAEFLLILSNTQDKNGAHLVDEAGLPVMMRRIGSRKRDYIRCWSDSALTVLLRRLSRWCALCDLQMLLGGSRSGLSRVFRFMLTMVNQRYGKLVSNVKIWSEYFQAFSQHFRGMGFPFDNGVLFVDDTLKETHGYSYQAAVFPNGVRAVAAILFCVTPLIPIYDYYCMEQVCRAVGNRGLGTKVVRSSVCVLRCVHTWLCTYAPRDTHSSSLS